MLTLLQTSCLDKKARAWLGSGVTFGLIAGGVLVSLWTTRGLALAQQG